MLITSSALDDFFDVDLENIQVRVDEKGSVICYAAWANWGSDDDDFLGVLALALSDVGGANDRN